MKMKQLVLAASLILILSIPNMGAAATTVGSKCLKVGTFTSISSKVAICTKKGTSLIWTLANSAQALIYQKQQQVLTITSRHKNLTELQGFKSRYMDVNSLLPILDMELITKVKGLNQDLKDEISGLVNQQDSAIKLSEQTQTNFVEVIAALNSSQASIDAKQAKVNSQISEINTAKAKNDAAYNSYLSVKAQSDSLSSAYQSAATSNANALAAKVLCDFGFAGCYGFDSNLYNFNASIIRQYNQASANTTSAYNIYSNAYSQYSAAYETWKSLDVQLTDLKNNQNSLTSKKNELSSKYIDIVSNIKTLQSRIDLDNSKLSPLNDAVKMIEGTSLKISLLSQDFQTKAAQFISAVDDFMKSADESYVVKAPSIEWDAKMASLFTAQENLEATLLEIKSLKYSLESALKSL